MKISKIILLSSLSGLMGVESACVFGSDWVVSMDTETPPPEAWDNLTFKVGAPGGSIDTASSASTESIYGSGALFSGSSTPFNDSGALQRGRGVGPVRFVRGRGVIGYIPRESDDDTPIMTAAVSTNSVQGNAFISRGRGSGSAHRGGYFPHSRGRGGHMSSQQNGHSAHTHARREFPSLPSEFPSAPPPYFSQARSYLSAVSSSYPSVVSLPSSAITELGNVQSNLRAFPSLNPSEDVGLWLVAIKKALELGEYDGVTSIISPPSGVSVKEKLYPSRRGIHTRRYLFEGQEVLNVKFGVPKSQELSDQVRSSAEGFSLMIDGKSSVFKVPFLD